MINYTGDFRNHELGLDGYFGIIIGCETCGDPSDFSFS